MRVIRLEAENIKRLSAVSIVPEGDTVVIGGKNGAGKSSVLDSISYALGGGKLLPEEPIRQGQTDGFVTVDLGDIIVTRRFKRKEDEVQSTLVVSSKEGAVFSSPQAMLDKLIGKLSFDPLAFARADRKTQRETLRQLVNLDTSDLDSKKSALFNERTAVNRRVKELEVEVKRTALALSEAPEEEISTEDIVNVMWVATKAREKHQAEKDAHDDLRRRHIANQQITAQIEAKIEELKLQLVDLRNEEVKLTQQMSEKTTVIEALAKDIPDLVELGNQLKTIEATNVQVRKNKIHFEAVDQHDQAAAVSKALSEQLDAIEVERQQRLAAVQFPVPGLGFSEDGVIFNKVPFEQASTAEQLKVSVAMGLQLNPKLKVILIRDGNTLDSDNLKVIAEMAAAADAQVWIERVAESKDGVTVMIEDGHVV